MNLLYAGRPSPVLEYLRDVEDEVGHADAGPFPHLTDDQQVKALQNCARMLTANGRVFVELRNEQFALYTANRHAANFLARHFLNEDIPQNVFEAAMAPFDLSAPPLPDLENTADYNTSYSRFNDLLNLTDLFGPAGLVVDKVHGYHFHAAPPMLESIDPEWFRKASLAMEYPAKGYDRWPRLFQASAVIVEAVKE